MTTKLRFKMDPDRIILDQIIGMQDGDLKSARDLLAACLVNGKGVYLEIEEAKSIIGGLTLTQVREAANEFSEQMRDTTINPTTGGPSLPPSSTVDGDQPG